MFPKTLCVLALGLALSGSSCSEPSADAQDISVFKVEEHQRDFYFMEVKVKIGEKTDNSKFFIGRLPVPGEAVEMVYVNDTIDGGMRFQLRVKK